MQFCTQSFTTTEVQRLSEVVSSTFDVVALPGRTKDGPVIGIHRRDDALKIKQKIASYVPDCFKHKLQHIRAAIPRGRALRKLKPSQVRRIRRAHERGVSAAELGRRYEVSNVTIINLVTRRTYKDVL